MTQAELLLVVASLALSGFIQGLTGFGFGIIAMALLPLVLDVQDAQAMVTIMSTAACLLSVVVLARHARWQNMWALAIGSSLGIPLGFWFLTSLPADLVRRSLGAVLCGMVLFEFLVARRRNLAYPYWTSFWIGLLGGSLSGAFNVGGPPMVAYVYAQPGSTEQNVATLSLVFLTNGLLRLTLLAIDGQLHANIWRPATWSMVPMLVAIALGHRLLRRVPQRPLRTGVYCALLAIGVSYLLGTSE